MNERTSTAEQRIKADEKLITKLRQLAANPKRSTAQRADDNASANQLQRRVRDWRRSHPVGA